MIEVGPVYKVSDLVRKYRSEITRKGDRYEGVRFIDTTEIGEPEHHVFKRGDRSTKIALANIDAQDATAFIVSTNWNNEILIRQIKWLPSWHLV